MSLEAVAAPQAPASYPVRFVWPTRVYYEDTDAGGVVYHARYLHYFERARTEWLRAHGLGQRELAAGTAVLFAVRSMQIDFHKPARLDDLLTVTVAVMQLKPASLNLAQVIFDQSGQALVAAAVRIACVDPSFRPIRLPAAVLEDLLHAH